MQNMMGQGGHGMPMNPLAERAQQLQQQLQQLQALQALQVPHQGMSASQLADLQSGFDNLSLLGSAGNQDTVQQLQQAQVRLLSLRTAAAWIKACVCFGVSCIFWCQCGLRNISATHSWIRSCCWVHSSGSSSSSSTISQWHRPLHVRRWAAPLAMVPTVMARRRWRWAMRCRCPTPMRCAPPVCHRAWAWACTLRSLVAWAPATMPSVPTAVCRYGTCCLAAPICSSAMDVCKQCVVRPA